MHIRPYEESDRQQLIDLWRKALPDDSPHNDPPGVIDAKLKVDRLLFVGEETGEIVGSVMAGYDGHRGWLYSVAIDQDSRRKGLGSSLVQHAVAELRSLGCVKINLQVRSSNSAVVAFYESLGFKIEDRISMGLLLPSNHAPAEPGSDSIHIRAFVIEDYPLALSLWSSIEGLGLNESDTPEAVSAFLSRNPGFSAVAVTGTGAVIGTILCGHNGRAGSIQHLAVAEALRNRGVAKRLINYAFERLAEANIPRCNIFVYNDNDEGNSFWLKNGWSDPSTWRVLQKHVEKDGQESSKNA